MCIRDSTEAIRKADYLMYLDKAEQQVVKLMKGPDGAPVELPFESTED